MSNTGLTITGSTSSVTNVLTSASSIITDGTRTLTSGILSSVATFKALATSSGSSTVVTPGDIDLYSVDGSTTNTSNLSSTSLSITGSTTSENVSITPNSSDFLISATSSIAPYDASGNGGNILFQTSNTSTGLTGANSIVYKRTKATPIAGDYIGVNQYFAYDALSKMIEYARQAVSIKNTGSGNQDGSIEFSTRVNGTLTNMLELNGSENQINMFADLDTNGKDITTTLGDIVLDSSVSAGTGRVIINTKTGTAGSGSNFVLMGNTLTSRVTTSTSKGGNTTTTTEDFLCLYLPNPSTGVSTLYKIALINV